jgi:hypothetical protein
LPVRTAKNCALKTLQAGWLTNRMFEIPLWCSYVTGPTHNNQKLEVQIMKIRELISNDRAQWQTLYRGYAAFYKVDTNEAKLDRLFSWLLDPSHPCEGLVAEAEDG